MARYGFGPMNKPPPERTPGVRVFDARFPGECALCGGRVRPGDSVRYHDDEIVHASCQPPDGRVEMAPDETSCPECHTVHAPHQSECW